jgi:hypothetical protein
LTQLCTIGRENKGIQSSMLMDDFDKIKKKEVVEISILFWVEKWKNGGLKIILFF